MVETLLEEYPMRATSRFTNGLILAVLWIFSGLSFAGDPPDLSKLDRKLVKEPSYTGKPLYALYVFGPEAKTRVWAVLDKSAPDAKDYNVLYFDRNADGDLTGTDERIAAKTDKEEGTVFRIGSFTDQATGQTHTDLVLSHRAGQNPMTMLSMKWCGKVMVRGGYAPKPGAYTEFAPSPEQAPVLWPAADGPLGFQFWMIEALPIGAATDVRLFVGHQGVGKSTFCAVPDTFLPEKVPVVATLIYRDKEGKEKKHVSELKERC
jgi:hypothetical protein